jgi:hypothetical protein
LPETLIDERIKERIREDYYGDRARFMQTLQAQDTTLERFRERIRERFILEAMTAKYIFGDPDFAPQDPGILPANLEDFQRKDRINCA